MLCFCSATTVRLPTLTPTANLNIRAVPPQLNVLLGLLGLENLDMRMDEQMGQMLPKTSGNAWISTTLAATAPNVRLPNTLPTPPGAMLTAMMRLSAAAAAAHFPLMDPKRLMAELRQAMQSLMAQFLPHSSGISSIPSPGLQRMALAAWLTLALREKRVCPMALARVDMRHSFGDQSQRMSASLALAAQLPRMSITPFALSPQQMIFAARLAAFPPLASAPAAMVLPPVTDPNFARMLSNMLSDLAAITASHLPIDKLLALASKLETLNTIKAAFGEDALTPAGIARVNTMLKLSSLI